MEVVHITSAHIPVGKLGHMVVSNSKGGCVVYSSFRQSDAQIELHYFGIKSE